MNEGIKSSIQYLQEFSDLSRQVIERTAKENPAGIPALMLQLETERRWLQMFLNLRDVMYAYGDIIDAEFRRLKGE